MNFERLRARFESRGFGVNSYANAYGFTPVQISRVLDGADKGVRFRRDGSYTDVQRIILQLRDDNVWCEKLPWEECDEKQRVSS